MKSRILSISIVVIFMFLSFVIGVFSLSLLEEDVVKEQMILNTTPIQTDNKLLQQEKYEYNGVQQVIEINWEKGIVLVEAKGTHSPNCVTASQCKIQAEDAAKATAYRDLVVAIRGVTINANITVKDAAYSSGITTANINGFLKSAIQLTKTKFSTETMTGKQSSIEAMLVMQGYIFKPYKDSVPKKSNNNSETLCSASLNIQEEYQKNNPVKYFAEKENKEYANYSSVIVDATNIEGGEPAIFPQIITEDSEVVFGTTETFDIDYAIEYGIAGWTDSIEKAKDSPRITSKYFTVKAIGAKGNPHKTKFIVSREDASKLMAIKEELKKGRIVIVLK